MILNGGWTPIKQTQEKWMIYIDQLASFLWLNDCPDFPENMSKQDSPQRSYLFKGMTSYCDSATRIHSANLWTSNFGPCVGTSEVWLEKKTSQSTPTKWWPFSNMLQNGLSPNHAWFQTPPKSQNPSARTFHMKWGWWGFFSRGHLAVTSISVTSCIPKNVFFT